MQEIAEVWQALRWTDLLVVAVGVVVYALLLYHVEDTSGPKLDLRNLDENDTDWD